MHLVFQKNIKLLANCNDSNYYRKFNASSHIQCRTKTLFKEMYSLNLNTITLNLLSPYKIERKRIKLKEMDKMGGNLKISMKSSFWSSCFSSYKYSIP